MVWAVEEPFSFLYLSTCLFHFLMVLYEHFFIHTPYAPASFVRSHLPYFHLAPDPPTFLGLLDSLSICSVLHRYSFLTCVSEQ
jgi:hypothetical protein